MNIGESRSDIRVPVSLLQTDELLSTAKLVWIALVHDAHLEPSERLSPTRLHAKLGLARNTITKAISALKALGWYATDPCANLPKLTGKKVSMSVALLLDRSLSVQARLLHGMLQTTSELKAKFNQVKYSTLSKELRLDVKTVRKGVKQLTQKGWLAVKQKNQLAPISFSLRNPIIE